jgi:cobalt-zinc-cadmium efflux system outer membrane protein
MSVWPWGRLVLPVFLLLWLCAAASAQEMTHEQALDRLERENSQMRALAARVRAVQAETQAWSLFPNPAATYSREDAAGAKDDFLLVQQSVPVNGRRALLRSAGSAQIRATEAETTYERLLLRSDFRASFYELLLAQQRVVLLESWVGQLRSTVNILQARQREGESSTFDRLRGERELADAEASLASPQIALAQARSRLASHLAPGTDPASIRVRGDFSSGESLPPLAELISRALSLRGDYGAGQQQLQRLGFERRAAARLAIPEPHVTAGLKSSSAPGRTGNGYLLSVTVSLPVFNRGQTEVNRIRATEERTQAELAARRQKIETDVRAAYEAAQLRRRIAEDYARELGTRGNELAQIAQVAYQEGEQGILELLDAHRVAMLSGLQALELSWLGKQAEIDLNRAVGEEVLP